MATSHSSCAHAHSPPRLTAERQRALYLGAGGLAVLLAPFFTALLCFSTSIANGGGGCPMLQATGVPCPACGATRAFVLFSHGDMGGAMRFNWSWLVLWFVIVGAMFTAAWRLWQQRAALPDWLHRFGGWLQTHPAAVVALPFALLLGPWLVALANLSAIR